MMDETLPIVLLEPLNTQQQDAESTQGKLVIDQKEKEGSLGNRPQCLSVCHYVNTDTQTERQNTQTQAQTQHAATQGTEHLVHKKKKNQKEPSVF